MDGTAVVFGKVHQPTFSRSDSALAVHGESVSCLLFNPSQVGLMSCEGRNKLGLTCKLFSIGMDGCCIFFFTF